MALGLLRALAERGRRVPEDVSVVGFDDIPEAGVLPPAADHGAAGLRRAWPAGPAPAGGPDLRVRHGGLAAARGARAGGAVQHHPVPASTAVLARMDCQPWPARRRINGCCWRQSCLLALTDPDALRDRRRLRHAVRPRGGRPGRATARSSGPRSTSTRHGVMDDDAAAPASGCRRTGRCRIRTTTATCCGTRCRRRSPGRGRPGARSSASAPTSPPARCCRAARRHAAVRAARAAPTARTPTPKLWKHHAAQPQADRINALAHERGEPWIARYGGQDLVRVAVRQGAAGARGGPGDLRPRGALDRGRRLDRLAADRHGDRATPAPPGTRASTRTATTRPRVPRRARPAVRRLRGRQAGRTRCCRSAPRAGSLTAQAADWTGLPAGIAVAVGNVDAHVTAPAAQAIEPGQMVAVMGTSTCHVMNGDGLAEVPGMCGVVDGGIVRRPVGLRGRAERRRRHLRAGSSTRRAGGLRRAAARRGVSVHELLSADWPPRSRSARTAWSRWTG